MKKFLLLIAAVSFIANTASALSDKENSAACKHCKLENGGLHNCMFDCM